MMHENEPLKKQPYTQIKMEQPHHSLTPHLDSFTKSTPGPFSTKTSSECLKDSGKQLVPGMCLPWHVKGVAGWEKVLCGWEGKWWAAGN